MKTKKWFKDNQRAIVIVFITFILGIIAGYNLDVSRLRSVHTNDLEIIENMKLRNAVLSSNAAKSDSVIDSAVEYADSISRVKDLEYNKLKLNFKIYKNEVERNRKIASTIPAAQYVIDSILQSNGIRN